MGQTTRAVIIGCGVAGPVLGLALRRIGLDVVICEARPAGAEREGVFLGVAPNGMNVLGALGIRAAVEAVSVPCEGFEFQNAQGRRIGGIDRSRDTGTYGARLQMIRRGDLHEALTAAARVGGVEVQFGRRLTGISQEDPSRVVARFEDGTSEAGDLLFGCDGLRSMTRRLVLPEAPAPAYSGLVDFAGFAPFPEAPLETGVKVMVFGRRAFFGGFKTPSGEVWWFHNCGEKVPESVTRDPAAMRARILELHRSDPKWIRETVERTPDILGPFPLHDILSMPRWHKGRVCLIGDAAHATTPSAGQGASMALEDALVVAKCLRDQADPARAFAAFEASRRARVEAIVRASRRTGNKKAVSGPVGEWFRDLLLPVFLRLGAREQDRTYAYRIDWAERAA